MANGQTYNQYTKCISSENYSGLYLGSAAMWALLISSLSIAYLDPGATVLGLIATVIGYCRWWLYGRLVCLGQPSACFIGLVLLQDTAYNQGGPLGIGKLDTDYTLYVLPAPYPLIGDQNWYPIMDNPPFPQGTFLQDSVVSSAPEPAFVLMRKSYTEQHTTETPTPIPPSLEITVQYAYELFISDNGVQDADTGKSLQAVSQPPTAGQYFVSPEGVYAFSLADQAAGMSVSISYSYIAGFTGETITGGDLQSHQYGGGKDQIDQVLTPDEAYKLNFLNPKTWAAGTFYLPGNQVLDGNGGLETCLIEGLSGQSAPNWPNPSRVNGQVATGAITPDYNTSWRYDGPLPQQAILEVEFEGAGVWILYQSLLAAIPFAAAAAAAVCAIPVFGWLACVLLIAAAALIFAIGAVSGLNDNSAEQDAENEIPNLRPGVDVLLLRGSWVWDGGHIPQGWNELHPIVYAQCIASVSAADLQQGQPWQNLPKFNPVNLPQTLQECCGLTTAALDPGTQAAQQLPQNGWVLHPVVDGCAPSLVF